ncbi:hypothetical protein JDM601_4094 [Mycolicibacter sinensis]|uniref:Uncharacterized protein n=1 Tax=Mycolicibacter sinensis (strain JDM601) TaxID=875328 RepID=F5YTR3_MYCSD|nr:hypothetical protein JDM601_4094 [Mycolicibacter sinensis]
MGSNGLERDRSNRAVHGAAARGVEHQGRRMRSSCAFPAESSDTVEHAS